MNRANQLSGSEWFKNSFSIWRGLNKEKDSKGHPAPFPTALASRLIECYAADPNGIVLDPFAGSGSTLLAAVKAGMHAVGMDINPDYREIFKNRCSLFENDAGNRWRYEIRDSCAMNGSIISESIEICITSPPYWDILNRRRSVDGKETRPYSGNGHDLGNIEIYDEFLSALGKVTTQVETALRWGGYFIINVMDLRKDGRFYPLHSDTISVVGGCTNLVLEDVVIWDRQSDYNSMRPIGYPYKFIINKVHEYLLVFRKNMKGNDKKI